MYYLENLLFGQNCLHWRLYQRVFQLWYPNLVICVLEKLDPWKAGRKKMVFALYFPLNALYLPSISENNALYFALFFLIFAIYA